MQRKNLLPRLLDISLDVSKIAVCIYSIKADGDLESVRKTLELQIENPKEFVKTGTSWPEKRTGIKKKVGPN